jgi:hypothetical protein
LGVPAAFVPTAAVGLSAPAPKLLRALQLRGVRFYPSRSPRHHKLTKISKTIKTITFKRLNTFAKRLMLHKYVKIKFPINATPMYLKKTTFANIL